MILDVTFFNEGLQSDLVGPSLQEFQTELRSSSLIFDSSTDDVLGLHMQSL